MSKRQKRIDAPHLKNELNQIMGEKLSIILKNGKVIFAVILGIEGGKLRAQDMRFNIHSFTLNEIAEVIIEKNNA